MNNRLLLSPRLSENEKAVLLRLQVEFEKLYGTQDYYLVPSSGSSQKKNESVKLIALTKAAVMNSARRFNSYFDCGPTDHWALVLPEFHVAGLGVVARAELSGARVFRAGWPVQELSQFLTDNKICYMSLVPGQAFDLAQAQIPAPAGFKRIFVGAGALNESLRKQLEILGWSLTETYGMTETASMIAVKEQQNFVVLPGVEVRIEDDVIHIQCDSLLTASIQEVNGIVEIKSFENDNWYITQDCAELLPHQQLRFLGRKTDYVKILGEGVSLAELKAVLGEVLLNEDISAAAFELVALEDERAGHRLILVVEQQIGSEAVQNVLKQYNKSCRPDQKIQDIVTVGRIPRTELGKLKSDELKSTIRESLTKGSSHG